MSYRIAKQFSFSATHSLPHLPEGHKCRNDHGHNYTVELVLRAHRLDRRGFVLDYAELDEFDAWLQATVDHGRQGTLNEVMVAHCGAQAITSAEQLAFWFFHVAARMRLPVAICRVSEQPRTWAEYAPHFGD